MSVVATNVAVHTSGASPKTISIDLLSAAGNDRQVVVFAAIQDSNPATHTAVFDPTGVNVAMTPITGSPFSAPGLPYLIYGWLVEDIDLPGPGTYDVQISWSLVDNRIFLVGYSLEGQAQGQPEDTSPLQQLTSTTISNPLTTSASATAIDVLISSSTAATATEDLPQVVVMRNANSQEFLSSYAEGGETTMGWSDVAAYNWWSLAVSFAASSGTPSVLVGSDPAAVANPDTGAVGQAHTLIGSDPAATANPDTGAVGQTPVLVVSDPVAVANPDVGAVGQTHTLAVVDPIAVANPDTGVISQTHLLAAVDPSATANPDTGAVVAGTAQVLAAVDPSATANPDTGAVGQTHILIGSDPAAVADPDTGGISQAQVLAATDPTAVANPDTGAIITGVVYVLAATDPAAVANPDTGVVGQAHILAGSNPAAVANPGTGVLGQAHVLVAIDSAIRNGIEYVLSGIGSVYSTAFAVEEQSRTFTLYPTIRRFEVL